MEFPKTIPREDMDLFSKECRLAGCLVVSHHDIHLGQRAQLSEARVVIYVEDEVAWYTLDPCGHEFVLGGRAYWRRA